WDASPSSSTRSRMPPMASCSRSPSGTRSTAGTESNLDWALGPREKSAPVADLEPMEGRWIKKRAGFVAAGVLVVAAALNAGGEETPTPQAADTTLPVANSTSSSVTTTMATTSTSTATTTTVEATTTTTRAVPFPEQEHADVIFAPVTA